VQLKSKKTLLESRINKPNKFEVRRQQLAEATLAALGEFGYAKTSLRDIAAKSEFSLGTLHYYFLDKDDLIAYCVRIYKRHFIDDVNQLVAAAADLETLKRDFISYFVNTVSSDSESHRLWYDIRSQAMFDPQFRPLVAELDQSLSEMISAIAQRIQDFIGRPLALNANHTYWILDGMFQHYLLAYIEGTENADVEFESELTKFVDSLATK
jgi:TetR/AcrR family transcriptional repressor of bet genes